MEHIKNEKLPLSLWLYIALWFFFVYLYSQIIFFSVETNQNIFIGGLYFIEFGVHEMSHIVTVFFPPIMTAAAGSFGEISFTILIVIAAIKQRAYFALIFALLWVTLAMNSVGRYVADARSQSLPLIGPGENPQHDWNFVFTQIHLLEADILIGDTVRFTGDFIGFAALLFGLWLLWRKIQQVIGL